MATELEELIDFLLSPSPPVKRAAVDIVRGLTGSEDGMQSLAKYSKILLTKLSYLLGDSKEVSEPSRGDDIFRTGQYSHGNLIQARVSYQEIAGYAFG